MHCEPVRFVKILTNLSPNMDVSLVVDNPEENYMEIKASSVVNVTSTMQVEEPSHASGNMMSYPASMAEHSIEKTCQYEIGMESDSSDADSDATVVDSTFSEEPVQIKQPIVTNTNTVVGQVTEILEKDQAEFENSSRTIWFTCSVCRFFFPNSKTLEEHNKKHHNHELPHICRVCATRFRSMYSLMGHCKEMHKNSKIPCKPCICLLCKQRFSDSYKAFPGHLRCHFMDIELQTCSICCKTERNQSNMEKHMLTHMVDVPSHGSGNMMSHPTSTAEQPIVMNTNIVVGQATEILEKDQPEFEDCSKRIWFTCPVCRFFFPNSKTLEEHNKKHHNHELPHICRVCATRFRSIYSLMGHCKEMHKNSKIPCRPCICLLCKQRFSDPYKSFRRHLRCHFRDIEVQTCSICCKTERNNSDMEKHMSSHLESTYANVYLWVCKLCRYETNCKDEFKKHKKMHQRSYQRCRINPLRTCEICGKRTQRLRTHMKVHLDTKDFNCSECGSCLKSKASLVRHIMEVHKRERGKHTKNVLKHKRSHRSTKDFCCCVCGSCFRTKYYLTRHMKIHTCDDISTCEICGKHVKTITVHMRMHTNERPYKCNICDAAFRQQAALINHRRIHTNERPYSCSVCGQKFTQQQAVTRHRRTHTGDKPYQCLVCHMRFTQSSGLKGHMRRHDKGTVDIGEFISI